jgi:two-component system sensor histidine kinase AgrC
MKDLFVQYVSYSHIIIIALGFFTLEKLYREKKSTILFFLLILIFCGMIGSTYSTLDQLILFILLFTFSYIVFPDRKYTKIILSIMCSALIENLISIIYINALLSYFYGSYGVYSNLFLFVLFLFSWIFCVVISFLLRTKLYPYLARKKKMESTMFFATIIVFSYQAVEIFDRYAENRYLFMLFLIFYCLLSALIITVIRFFSKNALLEAKTKNDKIISELQKDYVDQVKKQYQEVRKFRHDYTNLLSSISYYLESNKFEELKDYFANDILKVDNVLKEKNIILDSLLNIESLGIRSIFYTKLVLAQEKKIEVHIEIPEFIAETQKVKVISLVRIFGIFLDNAIEELESIENGSLTIVVFKENEDTIYIIQNTSRETIEPLQYLKLEGISTKGKDRGLGLSNVQDILLNEPYLLLETESKGQVFVQRLTILNEVN